MRPGVLKLQVEEVGLMTVHESSGLRWLGPTAVGGAVAVSYWAMARVALGGVSPRSVPTDAMLVLAEALIVASVLAAIGAALRKHQSGRADYWWVGGLALAYLVALLANVGGSYWHGAIEIFGRIGLV